MKIALLVATILLAGCMTPMRSPGSSLSGEPAAGTVEIKNAQYSPKELRVAIGATVTWTNRDPYQHTVTAVDPAAWGSRGSGDDPADWLKPGETYAWTFEKAGTYRYRCIPHSYQQGEGSWAGQTGTIVVEESPSQRESRLASSVPETSVVPSPVAAARTPPAADGRVHLFLEAREITARIAEDVGYRFWTFNATVPGPMLRVREGDTVEMTLTNALDSALTHSIDLHAVTGPGGGAKATQTPPGGTTSFVFRALNPGLYVYHCATPHVPSHVANGMYGLILVEPSGGLPAVDREYYVVQGELYASGKLGEKGVHELSADKMLAEDPEYFVFNGAVGALTGDGALAANVNETVRIYFGVGSFVASSFHVIGEIFDAVYPEGGFPVVSDVQTTLVPAGGATMVEMRVEAPGSYVLVDHTLTRAIDRGAAGVLVVSGAEDRSIFAAGDTAGSGH